MITFYKPGKLINYMPFTRRGHAKSPQHAVLISGLTNHRYFIYTISDDQFIKVKSSTVNDDEIDSKLYELYLYAIRNKLVEVEGTLAFVTRPAAIKHWVQAIQAFEQFTVRGEKEQRRLKNLDKRIAELMQKLYDAREQLTAATSQVDKVRFEAAAIHYEDRIQRLQNGLTEFNPQNDVTLDADDKLMERYGSFHPVTIVHRNRR